MAFSVVCMSLCPSFPFLEAYSHVWTFSGIAFLWDWNENWPFQVLWPLLSFQVCWHIECSTVTASSFRIWNSSTGIPSPPLALFVVMLPKAHLTSNSRMSGFRWVITPLWISGSWRSFLYSSSVYSWRIYWRREWQTTSVLLPWEPNEQGWSRQSPNWSRMWDNPTITTAATILKKQSLTHI